MKDFYKRVKKGLQIDRCENFALTQEQGFRFDADNKDPLSPSHLQILAEEIIKNDIKVLIVDVMRRVISFDENDATATSNFFNRMKKFRKYCGNISIFFLTHLKKGQGKGIGEIDIRDMIRGSGDIVGSADSVIGLERKTGKECFLISQIKSRSSLEEDKHLVIVDSGNKDNAILTEADATQAAVSIKTKQEECADKILNVVEIENQNVWDRQDLTRKLLGEYSDSMVFKGLKSLEEDGIVTKQGSGKNVKWIFNLAKVSGEVEEE
jgi:hypothetical protein